LFSWRSDAALEGPLFHGAIHFRDALRIRLKTIIRLRGHDAAFMAAFPQAPNSGEALATSKIPDNPVEERPFEGRVTFG